MNLLNFLSLQVMAFGMSYQTRFVFNVPVDLV